MVDENSDITHPVFIYRSHGKVAKSLILKIKTVRGSSTTLRIVRILQRETSFRQTCQIEILDVIIAWYAKSQ